jgi:hypothetical protein
MKRAAGSWTTKANASLHHAHALSGAFLTPLRCALSWAAHRAPRSASTYGMLVASDIQRGMRGILP